MLLDTSTDRLSNVEVCVYCTIMLFRPINISPEITTSVCRKRSKAIGEANPLEIAAQECIARFTNC